MRYFVILLLTVWNTLTAQNVQLDSSWRPRYEHAVKLYNWGAKNYADVPFLIEKSVELQKYDEAAQMAWDYCENHIMNMPKESILTRWNVEFMQLNLRSTFKKTFRFWYENQRAIDSVKQQPGLAEGTLANAIAMEALDSMGKTSNNDAPVDWAVVEQEMLKKYDLALVQIAAADSRIRWYASKKNWPEFSKSVVARVEKFGPYGMFPDKDWQYNFVAWDLFERSKDAVELNKALQWSDTAIKMCTSFNGQYYDTYANLLYKLGKVSDAIKWEEQALALEPFADNIKQALEKMKKGLPTWPQ